MSSKLSVPLNITVTPKDGAVLTGWDSIEGAEGYKLFYYTAENPDTCIKTRYSQTNSKTILGFKNGSEYLVSVCAFTSENGNEILGEMSGKIPFTPISETLKAQKVLCLKKGGSAQIQWELKNSVPSAVFLSENEDIAIVDSKGKVTAVSEGETKVTVIAEKQRFDVKIAVNRSTKRTSRNPVLMFAGDIMCSARHQLTAEKLGYDFSDAFSEIKETLSEADFAVGVLEASCCDGVPYEHEQLRLQNGAPNCNSPASFLSAVAGAGFDGLVTANNHNCDAGRAGLEETVAEIKRLGMENLGSMGTNPLIKEIGGIRVGFICCNMISNGLENDAFPHMDMVIGQYKRDYFIELVNGALAMGAVFIVAYQHWGVMNSPLVRKAQLEEARFMAASGADLIIGSHPHVLQRIEYIKTDNGRCVPCAFSLGNFITSMNEMRENRDSAILRAELSKDENGKVSARLSYIPLTIENRSFGVAVRRCAPSFSEDSKQALERIKSALGNAVPLNGRDKTVLLSGSHILSNIFSGSRKFRVDKTGILISQLAVCGTPDYEIPESHNDTFLTEMKKSLPDHIRETKPDFVAVDFYTAAGVSCYQMGQHLFTGSKLFLRSKFYRENEDKFTRLKPPFEESLWKERINAYAEALLSATTADKIVLFRVSFRNKRADLGKLRSTAPQRSLNGQIKEMEDYFISLVKPRIIDLAKPYFTAGDKLSEFENEYFSDALRAFCELAENPARVCVSVNDPELWLSRVIKYHESMTDKGLQSLLLSDNCAADMIAAGTNSSFIGENFARLVRLKKAGQTDLLSVRDFFAGDSAAADLIEAAEIIYAVKTRNLTGPYEFYELAFRRKFAVLSEMARLLSAEIGAPVDKNNAELAFIVRGKPQQKKYVNALRSITVDVWGSAVSRNAVERAHGIRMGKFVFRQPALFAYDPIVPITLTDGSTKFCGDELRRRIIGDVFNRTGFDIVIKSTSKWLMVDFYDLICKMAEYNGTLFRIDDYITRTEFYADIKDRCKECYLFEKRDMNTCFNTLVRFARDMSERYGKNIILLKSEPKRFYLTCDCSTKPMENDPIFEIKKKFIGLCEERFISTTQCYVIDLARRFHAAEDSANGSADTVRYEDEFYRLAGNYIADIMNGSAKRVYDRINEEYIILRDMKISMNSD